MLMQGGVHFAVGEGVGLELGVVRGAGHGGGVERCMGVGWEGGVVGREEAGGGAIIWQSRRRRGVYDVSFLMLVAALLSLLHGKISN